MQSSPLSEEYFPVEFTTKNILIPIFFSSIQCSEIVFFPKHDSNKMKSIFFSINFLFQAIIHYIM